MLKRSFLFGLLISLLILVSASTIQTAALSSHSFPQSWQGTWSGIMHDRTIQGKSQTVPMTLRIQPLSEKPWRYTWQITYGTGKKKLVRNYELVAKNSSAGHFAIDEKNGILIDAWWLGDKLYSQFKFDNNLLSIQYQLHGNWLEYELVVYQPLTLQTEGSRPKTAVDSYQLQGVQSAELLSVK